MRPINAQNIRFAQTITPDTTEYNLATNGDVNSMLKLGCVNYRDKQNLQSQTIALHWFKKASETGDARGMLAYGYLLSKAPVNSRNLVEIRQLLNASAKQHQVRALYVLSEIEASLPGEKQQQIAEDLLKKAAKSGDEMAIKRLAVMNESRDKQHLNRQTYQLATTQNIQRNNKSAKASLEQIQLGAKNKDSNSIFLLAQRYHRGEGVTRNFNKAFALYSESAKLGNRAATEMTQLILSVPSKDKSLPYNSSWMQLLSSREISLDNSSHKAPISDNDPLCDW